MNTILKGVFIVKKSEDRIWLENKPLDILHLLDYFKFEVLLHQHFEADYIKKILEALCSDKKLIIDFDKNIVKIIKEKEYYFKNNFLRYFNANNIQEELDGNINIEESIYTNL